jgi:hypothetical protein
VRRVFLFGIVLQKAANNSGWLANNRLLPEYLVFIRGHLIRLFVLPFTLSLKRDSILERKNKEKIVIPGFMPLPLG